MTKSHPPQRSSNEAIINLRQQENLKDCLESLNKASASLNRGLSFEFIALDLKEARDALNSALGSFASAKTLLTEDVLDNIFSRFCIGK